MRFCGACGASLADPEPSRDDSGQIAGQRRHITVMFCDLVGSTPLAEHMDPEDFREVISGYHALCSTAVQRFGGYVAQYQGDGVIAYFGYPIAHEDDARRAVRTSFEIFRRLSTLNEQLSGSPEATLQARVGIHTGTVITGDMGSLAHDRHSAFGDTVNVAARLQAVAAPGSTVVTDATLALLGDDFETEPRGSEHLRGITRPIAIHRVVGTGAGARALEGGWGQSPMVDRALELGQMAQSWQGGQARQRRAHPRDR
jgi:class 3 adenylate cyclase